MSNLNNNIDNDIKDINNKLNNKYERENNIMNKNDELNENELKTCLNYDEKNCSIDKGCGWNKLSEICEKLEVNVYTDQGLKGESYKLKVGNYDLPDIDYFDFVPKVLAIPNGLRVKIFKKSGFVGPYDLYIGNYKQGIVEEKHLQRIQSIGSIQICDMINCSKPS